MAEKNKKVQTKHSRLGNYLSTKAVEKELDTVTEPSRKNKRDSALNLLESEEKELESTEITLDTTSDEMFDSKTASNSSTPKPKKSLLKKLSIVFMALTIIACVYAGLFILTPLIIIVPTTILYLIWFVIVAVVSIATIGIIWVNDGWRHFSSGFLEFNNKIWNFANNTTDFMANTFIGVSASFGACVLASICISAFGLFSGRFTNEKYKASFIASIILAIVYAAFIIVDIYFLESGKSVI